MLGECYQCNSEVGYFKLRDGLCNSCIENNNIQLSKFKRLSKSMPVLTWLFPIFIIFQLFSPWILQGIASSAPKMAAIMNTPEIGMQFLFSITLLIMLFIPLLITYVIRFFVARRRLHVVIAWIILLTLFSIPISTVSILKDGSPPSFTTIAFLIVAFKMLRLENISLNSGIKDNG